MIINVDEFLDKYASEEWKFGIFLGNDLFFKLMGAKTAFIGIPDNSVEQILQRKQEREERDREYFKISHHRYRGIDLEKEGNLEDALDEYLESISLGNASKFDMLYAYRYCYDRAIILCRRLKITYKEIELLESIIKHKISDQDRTKYQNRLNRLAA